MKKLLLASNARVLQKNMSNNKNTTKDNIRAPIITVMGHVDHGKTSILDAIRKTNIQAKEHGGITQHIGAYQITHKDQKITFIDTPGHAAFTKMRARGGKAADLVVLVVAADEGVKPQTKEAISHARAAGVPMIVAINKIDTAGANVEKIRQELSQENVLLEAWGGDVVSVEVSAKTGKNLDKLLDAVLAVTELLELKGSAQNELEAVIIESKLDRKRGVVVSCIIKNGTLNIGDRVSAGGLTAKIKSIMDDKGNIVKAAGPATPVEILGFKEVPHVGDLIVEEGSELEELSIVDEHVEIVGKDAKRTIAIVLKADTQGTLEAVKSSLADLATSSVQATYALKFLYSGTGDISESDIMLAQSAKGVVIGFNVRITPAVADFAASSKVPTKSYKTIYDLVDGAEGLLEGTALDEEAKIKGRARVLKLFKLPSGDVIAGCEVLAGILKTKNRVSVYDTDPADITQDDTPLYTGIIKKLKSGKDDIESVSKGSECGVLLKPQFDDLGADMWIEVL